MTSGAQVTCSRMISLRCLHDVADVIRSMCALYDTKSRCSPVLGYEVPGEQIPLDLYPIANSARIA